jgi:molybdate transport system regulatory protein
MKKKQIRIRCWIEIEGERFFGPGPAELLGYIESEGSITQAARKMGMSYKKASDIVKNLNAGSRAVLVQSSKGGAHGGRAEVTRQGRDLVAGYHKLTQKLNKVLAENKHLLPHI